MNERNASNERNEWNESTIDDALVELGDASVDTTGALGPGNDYCAAPFKLRFQGVTA